MLSPLNPAFKALLDLMKNKSSQKINNSLITNAKKANHQIATHPILFASTFACFKNSFADYIIQTNTENKQQHHFNLQRNLTFALFGFLHVGAGQYIILNKIIPRIIPSLNKIPTPTHSILKALTLDQFIHVPLIYFPLFYTFKEFGESTSASTSASNIIKNYKSNFKDDMIISASIFMPIQYLNFKYIPTHYRVPILSSCGFLYAMLLSYLRL